MMASATQMVRHPKKRRQTVSDSETPQRPRFCLPQTAVLELVQQSLVAKKPATAAMLLSNTQSAYQVSCFALLQPALPAVLPSPGNTGPEPQKSLMGTIVPVSTPGQLTRAPRPILPAPITGNQISAVPSPVAAPCQTQEEEQHQLLKEVNSSTASRAASPSCEQRLSPGIDPRSSSPKQQQQQNPVVRAVADSACDGGVQQFAPRRQEPAENEPTSTVSEELAPAGEPSAADASDRDAEEREALDRDAEILDRDAEILDRDAEILDRDNEILDRDAEILDRDAEILDRDAEIPDRDSEISDRDAEEREASDRDAEILDRDAEILDRDAEIPDRDAEIPDRDAEIPDRDAEIPDRDAEISDRDAEERELSLEVTESEAEELEADASETDAELSDRDAELSDRDAELSDRDAELSDRDAEISDRDAEISDREDRDAEISDRDAELSDRDAELSDRDAEISDRDAEISDREDRDAELSDRDAEISDRDGEELSLEVTESEAEEPAADTSETDAVASDRDAVASDRDAEISDRDAVASDRDAVASDRDAVASDRDAVASDRDAVASDRDAEISDRDAEISDRDAEASDRDAEELELSLEVTESEAEEPEADASETDAKASDRDSELSDRDAVASNRVAKPGVSEYSLSHWQPRVFLFRLPVPSQRLEHPLPSFRLLAGDADDDIYLEEIGQDTRSLSDDATDDIDTPSPPGSPLAVQMVACSACRLANASIICMSCGRGFHQDCHIPPVRPDIMADWACSLCQDLSDPSDPFLSHRPQRPASLGLSLLNQRRCEKLLLLLKVKASSRLCETHLDWMKERLTRGSPAYQTAADFLSDVRRLFKDASPDDFFLNKLQKRMRRLSAAFMAEENSTAGRLLGSDVAADAPSGSKVTAREEQEVMSYEARLKETRKRLREALMDTSPSKRRKTEPFPEDSGK
ncbi:uncharacterized protein LOC116063561 [Sander lucioperca]|uniref:uncharacterized protein LOC116063561 n=1 Tax=Sander lucioperca TaxID=283035 RepID=UPI00165380B9|nr:uncharacterized protein LOC116063561 [Sander lucioperca]